MQVITVTKLFWILFLVICSSSVAYFYYLFNQKINQTLLDEAWRIENVLQEIFEDAYTEGIHIGAHITQLTSAAPHDVIKTIGHHMRTSLRSKNNQFIVNYGWVTPALEQVYDWSNQVYEKPLDVSNKPNIRNCTNTPWKLFFTVTNLGIISGFRELYGGIGITTDEGHLCGILSLSISLANLNQAVSDKMGELKSSFMVLSDDNRVIMQSSDNITDINSINFYEKALPNQLSSHGGWLAQPIDAGSVHYTYYKHLKNFPFSVVIGPNTNHRWNVFTKTIAPRLAGIVAVLLAAGLLVLHIKRRVLYNLRRAYMSRMAFIKELRRAATDSVSSIHIYCDLIRKFIRHEIDLGSNPQRQEELINRIDESAQNLAYNLSGDCECASTDLNKLVSECLDIKRFDFYLSRTRLQIVFDKRLIPIEICDIQIKQVFIELLTLSIEYNTKSGPIYVSTHYMKDDTSEKAEIHIEDSGHMFSMDDIRRISNKFRDEKLNLGFDVSSFNVNAIDHFVDAHNGTLSISTPRTDRRLIVLSLPYTKPEECGDADPLPHGENIIRFERR
jgi:hypothetical protein